MRSVIRWLAVPVMAIAGITAVVLPASAATNPPAAQRPYQEFNETIFGFTTNPNTLIVPVTLTPTHGKNGFYDRGTTNLGGPVPGIAVTTLTKGELKAYANAGHTTTSFNAKTCTLVVNVKGQYWNVAGTGRYRDALGHGTYFVYVRDTFPRQNGACDTKANPVSGLTTFRTVGPLALPVRHR